MMMSATGAAVAPPPTIPLPPPPPVPRSQRHPQQQQPDDDSQQPASRYRTLRGKSVSTPRLRAQLEVYKDKDGAIDTPMVRRRSKSFVAQRRGGTAPKTPPTLALAPRPVNSPVAPRNPNPNPNPGLKVAAAAAPMTSTITTASTNTPAPAPTPATTNDKPETPRPAPPAKDTAPPATQQTQSCPPAARESALWADEVARLEAETDRILAEQKKLDLARLQAQLATATAKTPSPKPKRIPLGKLTFLSRSTGRKSNASSSVPNTPNTPSKLTPTLFSLDLSRDSTPASSPSPERMTFIEMGGKGIVPQTDAPTSASNAGERRVTVRCMSSTINLPVTTDTSPVDIIYSSANFTTHQIDPASCIIVECYAVLGLERRLRRYERIRDVMNSWDRDQQNSLLITPIEDGDNVSDLDMSSVPRTQESPLGFSMHIYHSSRPGKWNKRWVTLSENGQMFSCKKPDGKASDKDTSVLCHLSDFDIYSPRESELRRHLKPPKDFCYAIKSQQKTAVFSNNTENFVHFFCTEDPALAKRFRTMVHGWRSWYLVNRQVDLQKKDRAPGTSPGSASKTSTEHKISESGEEKPYMIGQFQPLMDMNRFDKPMDEFGKEFEEEAKAVQERVKAEQRQLAEKQRAKALAKNQPHPLQTPATPKGSEEFSAGGLLGDGYEKRKQANATATPTSPNQDGPFTDGPSLLQQAASKGSTPEKPEPQSWFPSASEHSARSRSRSIGPRNNNNAARRPATADGPRPPMPQHPLLKLSQEDARRPPPRAGNAVKPPNGGPLINFATGGPTANAFQDGAPPRGVPRSYTGGRKGPPPPMPQQPPPNRRPRAKSTTAQQPNGGGRRPAPDERPPVPVLPHRPGRRDGLPLNRKAAVGAKEPLVNHAR